MVRPPRHLRNSIRAFLTKGLVAASLLVSSCSQSGQEDSSAPKDETPIVVTPSGNLPSGTPGVPEEKPVILPADFVIATPPEFVNSLTPLATWTEAPDVKDYDIIVSPTADCKVPLQAYGDVTVLEQQLTALMEGTYYLCVYAIQSVDGQGELLQAANSPYTFTVDITPPTAPTIDPVAEVTNDNTPEITWGLLSDADYYDLKVGSDAACTTEVQSWVDLTEGTQILDTLEDGTYYLCLTARDKATNETPAANFGLSFRVDTTAPTVVSISSNDANGAYKAGTTLTLAVTMSEPVWVDTAGGAPTLLLETGTSDAVATYVSGDGSETLVFSYTVAAGETAADLDVHTDATAFSLNGATILDLGPNAADLTVPTGATTGSLAAAKSLVIDTTDPTLVSVTSSSADGLYKMGDTITLTALFDEPVFVTTPGDFKLALETGAADTQAVYTSGSGSTTLTFTYTVALNDVSSDLAVAAAQQFTLGAATVRDAAGNNLVNSIPTNPAAATLEGSKAIEVDGIAPVVTSVSSTTADGPYKAGTVISIQLAWSEAVYLTNSGDLSLTLETGSTDRVITYSSGDGTASLTFDFTVQAGDTAADLELAIATLDLGAAGVVKDLAGNTATLDLSGATSLSANKNLIIDTTAPTVGTVDSVDANGYRKIGETVAVRVSFSEAVYTTVNDQTLLLETGGTDRNATYTSGSGTSALTFTYTVQAGDESADLDVQSAAALSLGTGTIRDAAGNDAVTTVPTGADPQSLATQESFVVDGIVPVATTVTSSTADGYYNAGDILALQVQWPESVFLTNPGDISVTVETGATDRVVSYSSGSGSNTLVFNYTVQAGDTAADLDLVAAAALDLGATGVVRDVAGNDANLDLTLGTSLASNKNLIIDTTAPTVTLVDSAEVDGVRILADTLAVRVNFSETVVTTVNDQSLLLETGGTDRSSSYTSGSGSSALIFTYTVQAGDESADLDVQSAAALSLGTGTIRDLAGNDAVLTLPTGVAPQSLASQKSFVVDGIVPTVTSVTSSTGNGYYNAGDTINIEVNFDDTVTVANTAQLKLWLETGATDAYGVYSSGNGTATLVFAYTVQSGENSSDLATHAILGLDLGTTTVQDTNGNDANVSLLTSPLDSNHAIVVDTVAPTISTVDSVDANGYRKIGETVAVRVSFSEAVYTTVNDQTLLLETGGTDRNATYTSGSGTSALTFTYTVQAGDESADLDVQSAAALSLGTGTIRDAAGNDAVTTVPTGADPQSLATQESFVVDGIVPTVSNVTSPTGNGTYKIGDVIAVAVNFNENVSLTSSGSLTLTLETGATDRVVSYTSGDGTSAVTFNYTVQAGDVSADLDTHATGITLNGATIRDAAGNDATLTLNNSLASMQSIVVDGVAPAVTSVTSSTGNGYYNAGDTINIEVNFDDTVTVANTAQLKLWLETGATDAYGVYSSGNGTATLVFAYTVQAGENSSDLATHAILGLDLGTTTIKDGSGNNAGINLLTSPLDSNQAIVVDTTDPGAFSITGPTNPVYSGTPTVTFGASAGASSYDLIVSSTNDCNSPTHADASPYNGIVGDQGVTLDDGVYYVCMTAVDQAGNSVAASNNGYVFQVETTAVHVSYTHYDSGSGTYEVRHALRSGGNTTVSAVDSQLAAMMDHTSLALDSSDKVHVSYGLWDGSQNNLHYGTNDSGSFVAESAEAGSNDDDVGYLSAVALTSTDTVHMVFRHHTDDGLGGTSDDLKESVGTAGAFVTGASIETLVTPGHFYQDLAMAIDSTDVPHIVYSYYDGTNYRMKYRNKNGGWGSGANEAVPNASCTDIPRITMALDSNDKVHVAYACVSGTASCDVYHATNASGSWVHTLVDTVKASGCTAAVLSDSLRPSIVVDANNKAHVAYHDVDATDLIYATNSGGAWVTSVVRSATGWDPLIQVDPFGKAYLFYLTNNTQDANLEMSTNNSGSWVHTTLDASGKVRATGEAARTGAAGRSNR